MALPSLFKRESDGQRDGEDKREERRLEFLSECAAKERVIDKGHRGKEKK
ncbi:hypothetical protein Patl1_08931 [Pistacia atlantica]|uniref:Uncharacterized protein n=1 Tax=Pistacia atlantica TaxID=434234 RepID=A0ACC1AJE9_9ROSI|nr:hypothetical protein Patl1_08931 [Pistacia atlantica]